MKPIILIVIAYVTIASGKLQCDIRPLRLPTDWLDMEGGCVGAVKRQIQEEIDASIKYMAMGVHFSQDVVSRPGFAEFFFQSATEKREQAVKLIEYLLMRTPLSQVADLIKVNAPEVKYWKGTIALEDALKTEAAITKKIKYVIQKCEEDDRSNDYHMVDFLTVEFLDKQYHDQRNLAEKISTLKKMMKSAINDSIGEFLFDKQFLA
ncbi:ferritin subunit-like [Bradysia coprophila]|uniref:ferritin subunit-like n=1 Tax=Bradysia coprophila TaxID=38358 RepID=UPI00187D76A9|nr:ferritin subunit-like [Bradysia coprophila]